MVCLQSLGFGIFLASCGALIWIVAMFVTGPRTPRAISIDIRSIQDPSLWILVVLLLLAGFYFEFRNLQRTP
jgi:hypothetical protein